MTHLKLTVLTALTLTLAACGGSGAEIVDTTPLTVQQEYTKRIAEARLQSARVIGDDATDGLANTRNNVIPSSGNGVFEGTAAISIVTSFTETSPAAAMIGDATVKVDFSDRSFGGSVTDLLVVSGTLGELGGNIEDLPASRATGSIKFGAGGLNALAPNQIEGVSYSGTVTANGTSYVIAGRTDGKFLGTRDSNTGQLPIKALVLNDVDGLGQIGNKTGLASIRVIAESR